MKNTITSLDNQFVKNAAGLKTEKHRREANLFLVEGMHLVEMACEKKRLRTLIVTEGYAHRFRDVETYTVSEAVYKKISSQTTPQGIMGICAMTEGSEDFGDKVLYLDAVGDPGNMGTILRTALAFGYLDVILSPECVSLYNEKVISSSQGAIFGLNIIEKDETILKEMKKRGYTVYITSLGENAVFLDKTVFDSKRVIVLGNEARGVGEKVRQYKDRVIKIAIDGIESLNVAVAGAIVMYVSVHKD